MLTSFFKKNNKQYKGPSTDELIERGFAPKNGRIDILFVGNFKVNLIKK